MKVEEAIGLIALLFAIYIFGIMLQVEILTLAIMLIIGGLIFLALYTKNNYAVFGIVVLIFVLLLYLQYQFYPELSISFSENYFAKIITFLIILIGFIIAYKLMGAK